MTTSATAPGSDSATAAASDKNTPRAFVILSLVLAVFFVGAVLAGARIMMQRETSTPVSMGPVDAPEAESATCSEYIGALPEKFEGFRQVAVMEPIPAGVSAYRDNSGEELTVRCGVRLPDQYTVLSTTTDAGGADWFQVKDATPGSTMRTWYSVGSTPTVAVTTAVADGKDPVDLSALGEPASSFNGPAADPKPYPLAGLAMSKNNDATSTCDKFLAALPGTFDGEEGYEATKREDAPSRSATYLSDQGAEPVVVRCGAEMPESYEPGERISQVNDVAWYADTSLAAGSTAGVWYALSHEQIVAVSMPNSAGNAVMSSITGAIEKTMKKAGN